MARTDSKRVLVVDNLADAADSMAMLVGLWGYDVKVSYDGAAALAVASTYRPQVVLLDVGMPGIDGFEVARRLRAQPALADTVIIGLSGWTTETHRSRGRLAGFDHYVVKPAELDLLQELLSRVAHCGANLQSAGNLEADLGWAGRERENTETIIRRCGGYTLVRTAIGFAWCMTAQATGPWYWHPKTMQWTGRREGYPTEKEAEVGFDPSTPERAATALRGLLGAKAVPSEVVLTRDVTWAVG
jgi:CheY-like chemotaxis protein